MNLSDLSGLDSWIIVVLAGSWIVVNYLQNRRTHSDVKEVKAEVKNSHSTNLRDDFDDMGKKLDILIAISDEHTSTIDRVDLRTRRMGEEIRKNKTAADLDRKHLYSRVAKLEERK